MTGTGRTRTERGLSAIIPVWNDHAGLARLLPQLLALPQTRQVIVADDSSDPPVSPKTLGLPGLTGEPRLVWLCSPLQRGAGHARNQALPHVRGSHVLYFDSDDLLLPDFGGLLAELLMPDMPDFDFCMFRHVDSRIRAQGQLRPLASDQQHWDLAGIADRPALLRPAQAARLARVSAYPWNKFPSSGYHTSDRCGLSKAGLARRYSAADPYCRRPCEALRRPCGCCAPCGAIPGALGDPSAS